MSSPVTEATRHRSSGACAACGGLECLERPRFFAGQLITEAELNSDQAYVTAKNRLHNRYLHGPGVVCGLQVVCDECDGWVIVEPGYAIDPCGNDVVVCQQERLNVLELIAHCRDGVGTNCDPVRSTTGEAGDCRGTEEHWCVTVQYAEREARPTTVLRRDSVSTHSCSCGCNGKNGHTHGNGIRSCGCGSSAVSVAYETPSRTSYGSARTSSEARSRTVGACEPTRIVEGYKLDVCEGSAEPCRTASEALKESALWEIVDCFSWYLGFFRRRVPKKSWHPVLDAVFAREVSGTPQELFDSYCYLRQALSDLDAQNPLKVRCGMRKALDVVVLQSPPSGGEGANEGDNQTYAAQAHVALGQLVAALFQYSVDCVCERLLPPCPPEPLDDRLVLACLTIVDGKIVEICNFGCRKHAGAWPTIYRWSTFVPVLPLLGVLIERLCCEPWFAPTKQDGNKVMGLLGSLDPTYRRTTLYESNFSQVTGLARRFSRARANVSPTNLATLLSDPRGFTSIIRSVFRPHV